MLRSLRTDVFAAIFAFAATAACGGKIAEPTPSRSSESTSSGGAAATEGGSAPSPGVMPGGDGNPSFVDQRIFSEQDTSFKVSKVYLGYTSNSCRSGEFQDYTYDRPTRTLTKRCDLTQPPAERDAHGPLSRVLELAEAERVEALLPTMVATQNPPNGGWDGRELYLEVGPRKFSWGNINGYGYPQASNLDALFSVFEGMPF